MSEEKVQILFPVIERWHCVDLMLRNLEKAQKPKNVSIVSVVSCSDPFFERLKSGLNDIFGEQSTKIIRKDDKWIDHDQLRSLYYETDLKPDNQDVRIEKLKAVYSTYTLLINNIDRESDLFWFIEDDTLFQLDIYNRYLDFMKILNADIITGVSYYWHTESNHSRNFWNVSVQNGDGNERRLTLAPIPAQRSGVVELGASGLGNVLAKRDTVLTWVPESYIDIGSGADISFFYSAMKHHFKAYGIWNIFLPHITKHTNGDIEIRGRIDKSLSPLVVSNDK